MLKNIVLANNYYDSATLMLLTNKIKDKLQLNSKEIAIMMATEMNKRIMNESNLLNEIGKKANSGDMLIAIISNLGEQEILNLVDNVLNEKTTKKTNETKDVNSVQEALEIYDNSNFAVVSLPGLYAAREVKKLLLKDKHVLLFSDNVSIEDEIKLKDLAIKRDLLMMGPDCGTAIINGIGLGFSNKVNKGNIGIVAASGTGLQEIATIISNNGGGISNAFGTGGRDIQEAIGGKMMLYCLDLLIKDENTKTIVIVSKPPAESVIEKIKEKIKNIKKPVVACFLGANEKIFENTNIKFTNTLEGASKLALELNNISFESDINIEDLSKELRKKLNDENKYIRGIYCGGTLAYETLLMLRANGFDVYSNLAKEAYRKLKSTDKSKGHTVLDMGDDEFTVGKPHPMIDPTPRSERLLEETLNKEVAVLIADIELGYGSNDTASEVLAQDISNIYSKRQDIVIIAVICGSKLDYQGYEKQKQILLNAGAIVVNSNAEAVKLAMEIMKGIY